MNQIIKSTMYLAIRKIIVLKILKLYGYAQNLDFKYK